MAISWGAWDEGTSGNEGFRVGVEVTVSAVTNSSTSVTFTTKWYIESEYNVNDTITLSYSGSISGSTTGNFTQGSSGGYELWATKTSTYNYSTYGSSPGSVTHRADLSGVYNGANPFKSVTMTIPARPYASPNAPTAVAAVRNTDTRATVSWTRNATAARPYTSVTVQRRKWTGLPGNGAWSGWSTVATTSSTATSFVDNGIVANAAYQYQVRSNNSVGSSGYVATNNIYTTPADHTDLVATLQSSGAAIVLTWENNHYDYTPATYLIRRSVAGGAYADVAVGLAQGTTTWTDNSPGAGTNQYAIRVSAGSPALVSTYAYSNVVSTTVPPLAPTNLSPNGVARDLSAAQVLQWKHNPGGDNAAQTAFIIEYSTNGGTSWNPLNGGGTASSTASYTIPAGTLANGTTYLWRVRTRGVAAAGYGSNSASATLIGSATPVVNITSPPSTVTTLPMTIAWTYTQAQSSPQVEWEASLYQGGTLKEIKTGTGTTTSVVMDFRPTAGAYTATIRAKSAAGLWSTWSNRNLTISLSPPAHITVEAEYQPHTGTTVLSLTPNAAGGGEVAVVSANIRRFVPGGEWITLAENVPVPNDFVDPLPSTVGVTQYEVTAVSATPTYRQEAIVDVDALNPYTADDGHERQWVFVNYGDAFTSALRFRGVPKVQVSAGRDRGLSNFLGRTKPTPAQGNSRSRNINVGGELVHDARGLGEDVYLWDSPPVDWEDAAQESEIVCYRDFTGRRVFGIISDVTTEEVRPGRSTIGFSVTETDYEEQYG